MHSGDAVFTGTTKEFKTGGTYTDKLPVKSLLQLILDPNRGVPDIPFFIVPGNHDQTGLNGPLTKFRTFIGPTRFGFSLPRIKTTIIGLNNIQQLGLDKNKQPIYGFPPTELAFLKKKHAFDSLKFQGTHYVLSGGAGAPLVKQGFLKGTRTPIFHIVEFKVKNGVIV